MTKRISPVDPLLRTDAYKLDRERQLPPNTTRILLNYTNRKSRIPNVDHVVHFGLQAYLQAELMDAYEPFFAADPDVVEDDYYDAVCDVLGETAADAIGTNHIRRLHQLGYLPLRFCGLPEGTLVPIGVPPFTVENTHPDFAWLPGHIETHLSASYWGPSTSATIAHEYRKILDDAAERTGAEPADVDFQGHDFSYRGMFMGEAAAASGAAHLLSFKGSDSLIARRWMKRYYDGPSPKSIAATEHLIMSAGTAVMGEFKTYERLLDLYWTGNVAIVSDTYDLWRVLTDYLPRLKDKILARGPDSKLVIRPDSGDPETILCGNPESSDWRARAGVVELLGIEFGVDHNDAGYETLDPHIGVIYGDSITLDRAKAITDRLQSRGFASTAVTLGIGSFSYQFQTRDTFGSAMKATWAEIDGKGYDLFKDPVTDDGTKRSAKGRLAVFHDTFGDSLELVQQATAEQVSDSLLQPIWQDGEFITKQTFDEVRKILNDQ